MLNFNLKKHTFFLRLLLILLLIFLVCIFFFIPKKSISINQDKFFVQFENGKKIMVDIADTFALQQKGLSGKSNLGDDYGMLFLFNTKTIQSFWMKDMLLPIDIIWLDNRKVVYTHKNLKPDDSPMRQTYSSTIPVNQVLETRAGFINDFDIKIGDTIKILK